MDTVEMKIGNIIESKETSYRIIGYRNGIVSLCQMETGKLKIYLLSVETVMDYIQKGTVLLRERSPNDTRLSDLENEEFQKRKELIRFVVDKYGPLYSSLNNKSPKPELYEKMKTLGILKDKAWRLIRLYLQSGLDITSIIDGRALRQGNRGDYHYVKKTGRPSNNMIGKGVPLTDEVKTYFDEAIKEYLSGRTKTKRMAYEDMLLKHYICFEETSNGVRAVLLPENQRPTYKQFVNYARRMITQEELDKVKTSSREQRNNKRLLLSDNLQGVMGPGDLWEVDECEIDLSLVSVENPAITVGRPIVYIMIDVYTRMIMAYSVAFDNNSIVGVTNCFLNLLEDKKELCARFGININADEWPSRVLPIRLRSDYGSEYISHAMDHICVELGITKELVSPATGSLKGQVEQLFHQIHAAQNPLLEGHGLIEKRYDSKHHREATLNIEQFERILVTYIIGHNRRYMENYPMTKDMRVHNISPQPISLWKYGVSLNGNPRYIANDTIFRYALLLPVNASIDRAGIRFKGLFYINLDDEELLSDMYRSSSRGRQKMKTARIDPRNIGRIYYLQDGKLMTAFLNFNKTGMKDYDGMSLSEYEAIRKNKTEQDEAGRLKNLEMSIAVRDSQVKIIAEASKRNVVPSADNLRQNRKHEKKMRAQKMMVIPENQTTKEKERPTLVAPKKVERIAAISAEEALKLFGEEEFDE